MTKEEFLSELENRLSGLTPEEISERVSFYREMIDDRIEDGASEEEVITQIGPVDMVVEQIMSEIPLSRLVKDKVTPKKGLSIWQIMLLTVTFPVWFPLAITGAIIVLVLYITIWIIVAALYIVNVALVISAVATLIAGIALFAAGEPAKGGLSIGGALVCAGLSVLWFFGCVWISKGLVRLTGSAVMKCKQKLIGGEA